MHYKLMNYISKPTKYTFNNAVALHTVESSVSLLLLYYAFFSCCSSLVLIPVSIHPHHPHPHTLLDHMVMPCMPSNDLYNLGTQKTSCTYKQHAYIQSKQTRQHNLTIKQQDTIPIALPFWFISRRLSFAIFLLAAFTLAAFGCTLASCRRR